MISGISVGSLTTFLNYANQYTKPFNEISGVVTEPEKVMQFKARVRNGSLTIDMPEIDSENTYHITVTEWTDDAEVYDNTEAYLRDLRQNTAYFWGTPIPMTVLTPQQVKYRVW